MILFDDYCDANIILRLQLRDKCGYICRDLFWVQNALQCRLFLDFCYIVITSDGGDDVGHNVEHIQTP